MKSKKVLLTATVQSHIAQFHKPLIKMLKEDGYEVHVAARDNLVEKNGLQLNEPDKVFNVPFDRSPLSRNNILAFRYLNKILNDENYDIVHCNTPMGGVITRIAANKFRKNGLKVFYTAHGFHFYQGAPKKNWMIYYPVEKFLARFTDKLITITQEDYQLAQSKFATDVIHVHGVGANSEKYYPYSKEVACKLRNELGYTDDQFILLCTGEFNKNKNQSTVIKAVAEVAKELPKIKLLLAGNGPMETDLKALVNDLGITNSVDFLGYRTDLEEYVNICDVVVSASLREGLPLNIMEGMLCRKPVIAWDNRGHRELVHQEKTGYMVNPNDNNMFRSYIIELAGNKDLSEQFGVKAKATVELYSIENVISELKAVYDI